MLTGADSSHKFLYFFLQLALIDLLVLKMCRETVYPSLESFSNNVQNTNDISDVQDGYGLMFSGLLGDDFPNCSSGPGGISSMHNEMSLPNGEVPLHH